MDASENSPQATDFLHIEQNSNQSGLTEFTSGIRLQNSIQKSEKTANRELCRGTLFRAEYVYP
jgi:hypothetical protein